MNMFSISRKELTTEEAEDDITDNITEDPCFSQVRFESSGTILQLKWKAVRNIVTNSPSHPNTPDMDEYTVEDMGELELDMSEVTMVGEEEEDVDDFEIENDAMEALKMSYDDAKVEHETLLLESTRYYRIYSLNDIILIMMMMMIMYY